VVDAAVVVPLLSLRVEVDAGPPSDHVNDSTIRLISEVFLFWCLGVVGVVDVWLLRVWRWDWGRYDLYLLVMLVCMVRWMLSGAVGVVHMCARQLLGCRLVAPETSCLWWPSFLGSPLLGARSLRRGTSSKICAATVPVLGPNHKFRCRGPRGNNLGGGGPHQRGAGWRCCVPTADCGRPDRSLTAKVSSMFG
jgi:hypothetical protein